MSNITKSFTLLLCSLMVSFPFCFYCRIFRFVQTFPYRWWFLFALCICCFSSLSISYYNHFITFIVLQVYVCSTTGSIVQKIRAYPTSKKYNTIECRKIAFAQHLWNVFDENRKKNTKIGESRWDEKKKIKISLVDSFCVCVFHLWIDLLLLCFVGWY